MRLLITHKFGIYLLALLPALVLYLPTLHYDWTPMDEQWMIVQNTDLHSGKTGIKEAFTQPIAGKYYRPVLQLSILFDHGVSGISPAGYHRSNFFLHLIAIGILLKLLLFLNVPRLTALIAAICFGVHPLTVPAVAWGPGRNDILLFIFTLLSIYYLFKFKKDKSGSHLKLHLLFFLIALFTKENAIVLPIVFSALYAFQLSDHWFQLRKLIVYWICLTALFLFLRHLVVSSQDLSVPLIYSGIKNIITGFLIYFGKIFLPVDLNVMPTAKNSMLLPGIFSLSALLFLLFKMKSGGYRLADRSLALAGFALFVLILLPPVIFSSIGGIGEHYEHRAYLPLAGIILIATQLKMPLSLKTKNAITLACVLVFWLISSSRLPIFSDKSAYVNAGINEAPDFYLFYQQKSELFIAEGLHDSAIVMLDKTIALRPDLDKAYNSKGILLSKKNEFSNAIKYYTQAIDLNKNNDYYYLNRFMANCQLSDLQHAMQDLYYLKTKSAGILPPKETQEIIDAWSDELDQMIRVDELNPTAKTSSAIAMRYSDIGLKQESAQYAQRAQALAAAGK